MKKVFKFLVVAALSLFIGGVANAQIKLGVSPGIQIPVGDFGDFYKLGFGGGINGEYLVTENIGVGLNVGYYTFKGKEFGLGFDLDLGDYFEMDFDMSFGAERINIIPITLNGKYYFTTEGFQPYGGVDAGLYMLNSSFGGASNTDMYFGVAPVLGFQYGFTDALALDLNAKYNLIFSEGSTTSTLGFNVGIVFAFGK